MPNNTSHFKWITPLLGTNLFRYVLGLVLLISCCIADLSFITIQKWIIDECLIPVEFDKFITYIMILFISGCLLPVLDILFTLNQHYIGYNIRVKLHEMLMMKLQRLPAEVIFRERIAKLVDYFTKDINLIGEELGYKLIRCIQTLVLTIATAVFVIYINPLIFILSTIVVFIYIIVGNNLAVMVKNASREVKDLNTELFVCVEEGICATREIITYNRMNWEADRYIKIFRRYYDKTLKNAKLENKQINITMPLNWLAILLTLTIGGHGALKGLITIGEFFIVYQYVKKLCQLYSDLFYSYMKLSRTCSSIDRLNEIFSLDNTDNGYLDPIIENEIICFKNVKFRYNKYSKWVLKNCTFSIPYGCKIVIVGTSGSGKSTLSKLLVKYYKPNDGSILIGDMDLCNIKSEKWTNKLSFAFQDPYIFPDTIRNNILLDLNINIDEIISICKKMLIHDFIVSLPEGYDTVIGERGINISGGQKQRLALARALIRNSEILIIDEATSALDMESERIIQKNINELRKGKTTLIIAHRLSNLKDADAIYVLDEGSIVGMGTHEELMSNNIIYQKLNASA